MGVHTVSQGESLASIAADYGLGDWRAVWDHPENEELRRRRSSPNVLAPGDLVFVPERAVGETRAPTGQRHRFVVRGATVAIKLTLRDRRGRALANRRFELTAGGATRSGTTDGDGHLEVRVPATADRGELRLHLDGGEVLTTAIAIGHLDPVDQASGVRQRLRHLGYLPHRTPGEEDIAEALRAFQRDQRLQETGSADEATRARLREKHKS